MAIKPNQWRPNRLPYIIWGSISLVISAFFFWLAHREDTKLQNMVREPGVVYVNYGRGLAFAFVFGAMGAIAGTGLVITGLLPAKILASEIRGVMFIAVGLASHWLAYFLKLSLSFSFSSGDLFNLNNVIGIGSILAILYGLGLLLTTYWKKH